MKRLIAVLLALCVASNAWAIQRKSFIIFTGATTDTTAVFTADSSSVFPTNDLQRLYLYLKPSRPCRVAIQVRSHGDSLSASGAPALTDTSKTFVWTWGLSNAASSADTLRYNPLLPTIFLPTTSEFTVVFPDDGAAATGKWGGPRGIVIPLRGRDGEWYWGQNTSIRLRVLGPSPTGVVTWVASLQGVGF